MSLLNLPSQRQKTLQIMISIKEASIVANKKYQIDCAKIIQAIKHFLLNNYALK